MHTMLHCNGSVNKSSGEVHWQKFHKYSNGNWYKPYTEQSSIGLPSTESQVRNVHEKKIEMFSIWIIWNWRYFGEFTLIICQSTTYSLKCQFLSRLEWENKKKKQKKNFIEWETWFGISSIHTFHTQQYMPDV